MGMLAEVQFTAARKSLTEIFDNVWHRFLPALIKRRQAEEVLLVRRDLQEDILRAYRFKPEILPEEDGSVTLALDELGIAVNAATLEEAVEELVREIKIYAEDYMKRPELFLNAPNRKAHFPYILRVWLCKNEQDIKSLLEL
ncbi:Antitoxin of toxin-antitoxin, RelE / RelB, TA system [Desulfofundulus thermosubterraneus DSM 16057]|uniref:Antitoxin of toxin-antitoxin, RelE / RelB, TA system n=2 Tax=Desulfofundulus TaxID=2282741 RepID=A0A1M6LSC9_9FIRM|nr:Antitoxin of toxin-antitoxin, RelE / RelB, TA system [Desulfofundulus thermosubterraneus DSM 16057]